MGESPVWDHREGVLYFVDAEACAVLWYDPASGETRRADAPGGYLGAMALRDDGGILVVMDNGFHSLDFATGQTVALAEPEAGNEETGFNDCKVDRRGRLIAGSIHNDCAEHAGSLYRLDHDLTCTRLDGDFICANGPCWSPDNRTLYVADSYAHEIHAYDYDIETGNVAGRKLLTATMADDGVPDGMTVDAEGYLWNARFGGGKAERLAPDRTVDRDIVMPVGWVTSVIFGGPECDVLYATTSGGEWAGERDTADHAGYLFAIHDLGVKVLPERRFAG